MQIKASELKTGMSFKYTKRQRKNRILLHDPMELPNGKLLLLIHPEYRKICHYQLELDKNHIVQIT